jgi:protein gp37
MNKSSIEWCDYVWNPVWGCLNDCEYCYARKIAWRFGDKVANANRKYLQQNPKTRMLPFVEMRNDLKNFKPTWLQKNFDSPIPKKPSRIFVNSMSDIAYWEPEWMGKVLNLIRYYPQHTFIFLTKQPNCYFSFNVYDNCILGATAVNENEVSTYSDILSMVSNKTFLSIEPIQEKIDIRFINEIDWLIIGAETGNRKNKIIPKPEWIEEFRNIDIPVFMKNNLRDIVKGELRQEFPKNQKNIKK